MSNPSAQNFQKTLRTNRRMFHRQRRQWLWVIAVLFACALLAPSSLTNTARAALPQSSGGLANGSGTVPIIVKFKASATAADVDAAIKGNGGTRGHSFDKLRTHVVHVPAAARDAVMAALAKHPQVERVNAAIKLAKAGDPNDTGYAQQWALPKIAWNQAYGVVAINGTANLAILDTGVQSSNSSSSTTRASGS